MCQCLVSLREGLALDIVLLEWASVSPRQGLLGAHQNAGSWALAVMARLVRALSYSQKVAGLIPTQGMSFGGGFDPWSWHIRSLGREETGQCFCLAFIFLSLPSFLLKAIGEMSSGEDKKEKRRFLSPKFSSGMGPGNCISNKHPKWFW